MNFQSATSSIILEMIKCRFRFYLVAACKQDPGPELFPYRICHHTNKIFENKIIKKINESTESQTRIAKSEKSKTKERELNYDTTLALITIY